MTTAPAPLARRPLADRALDLRTLLRLHALCAASGVVMVAAAPAVADLLGPDAPVLAVRVVGAALLVRALDGAVRALGVAAVVGGLGLVQLRAARRRPSGYSFSSGA